MSADDEKSAPLPPEFLAEMLRSRAMQQMTRDELLLTTWSYLPDGSKSVHFVLEGNLSWESELGAAIQVPGGELAPDLYDPPGARTPSLLETFKPRRQYRLTVPIDPICHNDPAMSRRRLAAGIRSATVLADSISLLAAQPVRLLASRRMVVTYGSARSPEPADESELVATFVPLSETREQTSTVLTDAWIKDGLSPFLRMLGAVADGDVRRTIEVAISWHAQANHIGGLGQYAQYWASIELLANFFYEYCRPDFIGRKSDDTIRAEVYAKFIDAKSPNAKKVVEECGELLRPTAQTKVRALLRAVFPKPEKEAKRDAIRQVLFAKENGPDGRPDASSKSLYEIRNDVAHGNISALDRDYYDQHAKRLDQFRHVSQSFIFAVLEAAPVLIANRATRTFDPTAN